MSETSLFRTEALEAHLPRSFGSVRLATPVSHQVGALVAVGIALHWDVNHFVVLCKVTKCGAVIHDPAVGERSLDFAVLSKHVTGIAIELHQGPNFQYQPAKPSVSLRTLMGAVPGLGRALLTIFGLALALELFALLGPQLLQMVVDQVLADVC